VAAAATFAAIMKHSISRWLSRCMRGTIFSTLPAAPNMILYSGFVSKDDRIYNLDLNLIRNQILGFSLILNQNQFADPNPHWILILDL
jgi:hypothetical protein